MKFRLLERFGVELEYMLVRVESLDIAPVADLLLFDAGADMDGDLTRGGFGWSNELTNHIVELKTANPVPSLDGLQKSLHDEVRWFIKHAAGHGCTLLPTAMHPWMNPAAETVLWPHGNAEIYQTYDRIFYCQGHGWANVQSTHLNLSFCGDEEFARLHAAVRLLLPLIPALAASSPFCEGKQTNSRDARLFFYRDNQSAVPEIAGSVVPEALYTESDYRRGIFDPIATAMKEHDPEGILELDFLNSRGAIARFDRGAIEIRVVDIQECPAADIAILQMIIAALRWILETADFDELRSVPTDGLARLLWRTAELGEKATIDLEFILKLCGFDEPVPASMIWRAIFSEVSESLPKDSLHTIATILVTGTLATRILKAAGDNPSRPQLGKIYRRLADCLARNTLFIP